MLFRLLLRLVLGLLRALSWHITRGLCLQQKVQGLLLGERNVDFMAGAWHAPMMRALRMVVNRSSADGSAVF